MSLSLIKSKMIEDLKIVEDDRMALKNDKDS